MSGEPIEVGLSLVEPTAPEAERPPRPAGPAPPPPPRWGWVAWDVPTGDPVLAGLVAEVRTDLAPDEYRALWRAAVARDLRRAVAPHVRACALGGPPPAAPGRPPELAVVWLALAVLRASAPALRVACGAARRGRLPAAVIAVDATRAEAERRAGPAAVWALSLGRLARYAALAARCAREGAPAFLRFGAPPPGGRSRNHRTGGEEAGVSAYPGWELPGGEVVLDLRGVPKGGIVSSVCAVLSGRPVYRVEGTPCGTGSDGEPVLAGVRAREVGDVPVVPIGLDFLDAVDPAFGGAAFGGAAVAVGHPPPFGAWPFGGAGFVEEVARARRAAAAIAGGGPA